MAESNSTKERYANAKEAEERHANETCKRRSLWETRARSDLWVDDRERITPSIQTSILRVKMDEGSKWKEVKDTINREEVHASRRQTTNRWSCINPKKIEPKSDQEKIWKFSLSPSKSACNLTDEKHRRNKRKRLNPTPTLWKQPEPVNDGEEEDLMKREGRGKQLLLKREGKSAFVK